MFTGSGLGGNEVSVAPSNLHSCNVLRGKATADSRRLHTTRDMLTFHILPTWNVMLSLGRFTKAIVTQWSKEDWWTSHGGADKKTMFMTLQLCYRMRHRAGEPELEQLKNRNQETASDQLEAIMGLRDRAAGK